MSRWYFNKEERQDALIKELKEWRRTPFRHRAAVKKVGADCVHFLVKVFENVGVFKNVLPTIPYYGHDWCHHTTDQILYKACKRRPEFVELNFKHELMNGDIVLYQFGLAASHCAIYFDKNIYQSIDGTGVHHMLYIDNLWYKRRKFLFRVRNV